jgi:2-polyprenyl-6-methoxyphenol hydroxylase-like FAD-dependent oxidoreductase
VTGLARTAESPVAGLAIGVVGCGTAGSAAALLLARAGHRVTVLERVAAPGPVGAGIIVQPTGQAVLARLGLLAAVEARAARIDRLWCRRWTPAVSASADGGDGTLVDLRYAEIASRWHGLGVHRGLLFQALFDAVQAAPIDLRLGVAAAALQPEGARHQIVDSAGTRHGPFDLVVVADGAVSELRGAARGARDRAYPWGALWFVADDPDATWGRRAELYQVVRGTARMYGALPTGLGPRGETPVVSLFWSLRADRLEAWRAAGLAPWKEEVRRFDPRIAPVLDQIRSPEQIVFARYRDVTLRAPHAPGLVFLGDAAHATSPQLGQGANLALWDAMVLADALAGAATLGSALAAYAAVRRPHLAYYQRAARWLTPFFQSDSPALGWLRDRLMPIGNAIGPLRRRMVRTMAGVERGPLYRRLALPSDSM